MKTIKLQIPPQYHDAHVPSVRTFYDHLIGVLRQAPVQLRLCRDAASFRDTPADLALGYHTHDPHLINVKIGYLPDHFYIDPTGYSGWSTLANAAAAGLPLPPDDEQTHARFGQLRDGIIDSNLSKYPQPKQCGAASPAGPVASQPLVLFTQTTQDAVAAFMPKPWVEFLPELVTRLFQVNPKERLIIKRHPRCDDPRMGLILDSLKFIHGARLVLSDASIHDLIRQSRAVIVGNSGVGFEALLHEKPVMSFAHSDYRHATLAFSLDHLAGYNDALARFGPDQQRHIRRFVVYYLDQYMVPNHPARIHERLVHLGVI